MLCGSCYSRQQRTTLLDLLRGCASFKQQKKLSSSAVLQLLHAAVHQGSAGCTAQLCQLPGVAQLSADAVQQLLQQGDAGCRTQLLNSIPAELACCLQLAQLQTLAESNDDERTQ